MLSVSEGDDPVTCLSSVALFTALKKSGVTAERHIFSSGGHGYGLRPTEFPVTQWPERAETVDFQSERLSHTHNLDLPFCPRGLRTPFRRHRTFEKSIVNCEPDTERLRAVKSVLRVSRRSPLS